MGVLYLNENTHIRNWDIDSDWSTIYIKTLIHACTQAYFQIDGENPYNPVNFEEY